jgi:hypothetical protein
MATALSSLAIQIDVLSLLKVPILLTRSDNLGNLKVVIYLSGSSRVTIAKGGVNVRGIFLFDAGEPGFQAIPRLEAVKFCQLQMTVGADRQRKIPVNANVTNSGTMKM